MKLKKRGRNHLNGTTFGGLAVDRGYITASTLHEVLHSKPKDQRIGEALVQSGKISLEQCNAILETMRELECTGHKEPAVMELHLQRMMMREVRQQFDELAALAPEDASE